MYIHILSGFIKPVFPEYSHSLRKKIHCLNIVKNKLFSLWNKMKVNDVSYVLFYLFVLINYYNEENVSKREKGWYEKAIRRFLIVLTIVSLSRISH